MTCFDLPHPLIERKPYLRYGISKPVYLDLNLTPHMICAGGTGSGKTTLAKLILAHVVRYEQQIGRIEVYVCDYKGQDYSFLDGKVRYYPCESYSDGIDSFCERFRKRLRKEERVFSRCVLLLDEFNSYIGSLVDKKKQELYKEKLAFVVNMSRTYNMNVLLCGQRIDSSIVGTSRDSFGFRVGLSSLSKETFDMLFPGFPECRARSGMFGFREGYLLQEGRGNGLCEVIVPAISDKKKVETMIFSAVE